MAVMTDPRFTLALGISVLSGAVRGFSGFGSALIYVPLMSALYGPQIGAASFLLIDFATGIVFSIGVWRLAVWREVIPLVVAAVVRGTIRHADPAIRRSGALRWPMAALVLVIVVVLGSGWRYHGKPAADRHDPGRRSPPARSAARCRSPGRRWCCSGSPAWRPSRWCGRISWCSSP